MSKDKMKYFVLTVLLMAMIIQQVKAGPPFNTDDPEPVEFKHWEYYISTINIFKTNESAGTIPHFEINYGLIPNVQVHLILPLNYDNSKFNVFSIGYSYTEVGLKYRFVQETDNFPQIGTFPIIEIPTIRTTKFGNGETQLFIPLWIQKSWGKLTTYGGAGYWFNPGIENKNWFFTGWETQYDFTKTVTLGGEVYYQSADVMGSNSSLAFNTGGSINFSKKFHIIFSIGHSLINESYTTTYLGFLWTI